MRGEPRIYEMRGHMRASPPPTHPRAKPRYLWSNTRLKRGCLGLSRLRESLGT